MTTFAEAILFVPTTSDLSDETIQILSADEPLSARLADEIAALKPFSFAVELASILPSLSKPQVAKIAAHIVNSFKELGFGAVVEVAPVAAPPLQVEIKQPTTLESLGLGELLQFAQHNPERKEDVLRQLKNRSDVAAALRKTADVVVPNAEGNGYDAQSTSVYITGLSQGDAPSLQIEGRFPVSLEQALGIDLRRLVNLLTGELLNTFGRNRFGQDLLGLFKQHEQLYYAISWARDNKTSSKLQGLFPVVNDEFGLTAELLRDPNAQRWALIAQIYQSEKAAGRAQEPQVYSTPEGPTAKKSDSQGQFLISDEALENFLKGMSEYPDIQNVLRSFPREETRLIASKVMQALLAGGDLTEEVWDDIVSSLPSELGIRLVQSIEKSAEKEKLNEWDYKVLVKTYAKSNLRPVSASAGSTKSLSGILNGGIIASGSTIRFQNPILIADMEIGSGSTISGIVRLPIDVNISTGSGCSENIIQQTITWEAIAREIGLV